MAEIIPNESQARKLVKRKNQNAVKSLEQQCHFRVMQMCCEMATMTKDLHQTEYIKWKSLLLHLPQSLLDNLKSDFDYLCPSRTPLFSFDCYQENFNSGHDMENIQEQKSYPKSIKTSVKHLYGKNQGLDDSKKVFQLWHQFFDQETTQDIGPMLLFNSTVPSFLRSISSCVLTGLCISYNSRNKLEFPLLLSLLKDTLKNLRIFEDRRLQNEVLDIVTQSDCQLESLRMNGLMKIDSTGRILKYLQSQQKSLKSLDLTKILHGSCFNYQSQNPAQDLDLIFKQISKMENLEILYVPGIDLVNKQLVQDGFENLKHLNISGLYLHIRYIQMEDLELKQLSKYLSLVKIRLEYMTCKVNSLMEMDPPNSLDNIYNISVELKVQNDEDTPGWIHLADWKNLRKLTVQDFNESKGYPWKLAANIHNGNFNLSTWSPRFPQLTTISIRLVKIPFPYCSLKSLLFGSPNLLDLSVVLYNKDATVQNFDANDFHSLLNCHQLNLTHLRLLKRHAGISCNLIIPFQSLIAILIVSPNIFKVEVNLQTVQILEIIQKFNIEVEESNDVDAMFDPDFDIESEESEATSSDYDD